MSIIVLSNNVFFRRGMYYLLHDVESEVNHCYLDISSFKTLGEIRKELTLLVDERFEIILIKGRGIGSRILSSFASIDLFSPIPDFESSIGYSYNALLHYLDSLITLRCLTVRQQYIVRALIKTRSIKKAAFELNVNVKTVYTHTQNAAARMNFRSGCDLVNNLHILV